MSASKDSLKIVGVLKFSLSFEWSISTLLRFQNSLCKSSRAQDENDFCSHNGSSIAFTLGTTQTIVSYPRINDNGKKDRNGARSAAGRMTAVSLTRNVREHGFQMRHYRGCAGDPLKN
ncbi:hypothetical protein [Paraburkholderia sp. BL18I3N2]|uniref:hypothetical protein n=1 Tax=Paraburkholderia sp. BL18I3N2 TaxID=1938799 RepID=UPI0011B24B78|nr:hypothetical protein [Paraburkholderia sp. BL18I3N2]